MTLRRGTVRFRGGKSTPKPSDSLTASSISVPRRPSFGDALAEVTALTPTFTEAGRQAKEFLPSFERIKTPEISTPTDVGPLQNFFTDDRIENLRQAATRRLEDKFFGHGGTLDREGNVLKRRGVFGSDVANRDLSNVFRDFGSNLADLESNLIETQARGLSDLDKAQKEIERQNIQERLDQESRNAELQLETALGNIEGASKFGELGLKGIGEAGRLGEVALAAAGDEQRSKTEFEENIFEQRLKDKASTQDFITSLFGTLGESLGTKEIDPEARDVFEATFADILSQFFN